MISIRRSGDRGHRNYGWLDTFHTFSFNDYRDPAFMGFRSLRVINEDRVAPGEGFGTHPHRDMEIITYVLSGALAHRDSMGTGSTIRPGDVQRMSAGSGVTHSEFNGGADEPVHFLQIWLLPDRQGIPPSYEQKAFSEGEKEGRLRLIASRDGREGSVTIHQDADLYGTVVGRDESVTASLRPGRHAWVQVARGSVTLNGVELAAGDGARVSGEEAMTLKGLEPAEVLVFDLA
jgi:redox-sensitive bicupin YhaK (pirin superfamily)